MKPEKTVFLSAEEAWLWAFSHKDKAANRPLITMEGAATPFDVFKILETAFRYREISAEHLRILRIWGQRQKAPDTSHNSKGDARLWGEAMKPIADSLAARGWLRNSLSAQFSVLKASP